MSDFKAKMHQNPTPAGAPPQTVGGKLTALLCVVWTHLNLTHPQYHLHTALLDAAARLMHELARSD